MHLPLPRSLSFRLCFAAAISFAAASSGFAQSYVIQKGANFIQTGPGAPSDDPLRTYEFGAYLVGAPTSLTLKNPGGQIVPLSPDGADARTIQRFTSKAALDAAFTNGTYTLRKR